MLAAVSALVDLGNKVIFDRDPKTGADLSFLVHKATGRATKLRRERNVWVLDAWIEEEEELPPDNNSGFGRPE